MKLLLNLIRKDFMKNKVITTALAVFLIISALFMAGGLRVAGTVVSSLNGLNELAMPTEYLQMHTGPYDEDAFGHFVETHPWHKGNAGKRHCRPGQGNQMTPGTTVILDYRLDYFRSLGNMIKEHKISLITVSAM